MFMYMFTQAATLNQVDYRSDVISHICLNSIILYCMCQHLTTRWKQTSAGQWSSLIHEILFPFSHPLQPLYNHGKGQR